jgi:DNA-binding beta-propeller fold protein YncE
LGRLESDFAGDVVVVGVHSPKFTAERELDNVRAAVLAHGVHHAVVSDPDHHTWQSYAVRAWPTLMFVDPLGRVVAKHEGELHYPQLGEVVSRMVAEYRANGLLGERTDLPLQPEPALQGQLAFPGKVAVDPANRRLAVSDSGHHRVLVADLDDPLHARIVRTIGSGERGLADGTSTARFDAPQGLALDGETLYVADTENHAIRKVLLGDGTVSTIAGTGSQAIRFHRGGPALEVALSSPWDLALSADRRYLFVAMAGFHQVWVLDLLLGEILPYAGTGHEGIKDEARARAWHAQPYGLGLDEGLLYVADSETSAVRVVDTATGDGAVRTLVGTGLFDFGDRDGSGGSALLQHAAGVAVLNGAVWVADSFNNKLRKIDLATGWVSTAAGNGRAGAVDGTGETAQLWNPSGLCTEGTGLFLADTNNHMIRHFDPSSTQLSTVEWQGP